MVERLHEGDRVILLDGEEIRHLEEAHDASYVGAVGIVRQVEYDDEYPDVQVEFAPGIYSFPPEDVRRVGRQHE